MSSSPISLRIDHRSRARLAADADLRRESQHTLALRLLEEELRMLDHPGIVSRDGPTGRRASLIAGPDVWKVIGGIRGASGDADLDESAEDLSLARAQVDGAIRYYGEFGAEIDDRTQRNSEGADRRRALFQEGADALA